MNLIQNQQKMLDILFAKKNRAYGAYAIRSSYGETLLKSVGAVCITLVLTFGSILYFQDNDVNQHQTGQVLDKDSLLIVPFKLLEEKQEIISETRTKENLKQPDNNTKALATDITRISDHTPDTAAHQNIQTDVTSSGTLSMGNGNCETSGGGQNGSSGGKIPDSNPLDLFAVDENPEFEGGINALLGFVRRNVKYPALAAENSRQGTLHVKFVVDEDGNVSQIELLNRLGYGLDDEARRVVSMIPKFKSPGKVKGKPVKTYYQLPIKFKLG